MNLLTRLQDLNLLAQISSGMRTATANINRSRLDCNCRHRSQDTEPQTIYSRTVLVYLGCGCLDWIRIVGNQHILALNFNQRNPVPQVLDPGPLQVNYRWAKDPAACPSTSA